MADILKTPLATTEGEVGEQAEAADVADTSYVPLAPDDPAVATAVDPVQGTLRHLQHAAQTIWGAPGYKALLRRFGEMLAASFGVTNLDFVRLSGQGAALVFKPRAIKVQNCASLGESALAAVRRLIANAGPGSGLTLAELGDGILSFAPLAVDPQGERAAGPLPPVGVALVEDPQASGGCLIVWQGARMLTATEQLHLEHVLRLLQHECRWLRKLDSTQSLLYQDDLTGLYNTRYFEVALDAELRRADRFQTQFCLLFVDLDGFKPVNDTHGHLSGSSVLRQVADVIRDAVREVDVAIRYGGDEFIVVLLGATAAKGFLAAERLRRRIEQKDFRLEDGTGTVRITASIGLAAYPEHGKDRETLVRAADETMYSSKRAGKNRVTIVGQAR